MAKAQTKQDPRVVYYMGLDITANGIEDTKLKFLAPLREATLLGKIYKLEHPGREIIAAPLEARSFAKLTLQQLQWLYWNTFGERPSEDYAELCKNCLEMFKRVDPTEAEESSLESQLALLEAERSPSESTSRRAPREPGQPATPKATSTCGLVWSICDKHLAASGNKEITKELRAQIMAECESEGINKSTSAVQFGKWKASKSAS